MRLEPVRQRTRIHTIQAGALAAVPIFFLAQPTWQGTAHEFIEIAGIVLVFACIFGRMWSILYVGSKKNKELVTSGPYSMTRNPLYFFSCIGAVGVGLMYGSVVVALALARQRLMTASFDYYQLADRDRGVDGGFRYKTLPHVTLRSIAQNEPPETETLYDQPLQERGKSRVSGPFTVEQIPSFGIDAGDDATYDPTALDEDARGDDLRHRGETDPVRSIGELVDLLRIDGVRLPGGRKLDFTSLAPSADGGQIHASGEFEEAGESRRIAVSFGPLHGPISARQVEDVLRELAFAPYHAVLFAGFAIDGSAQQLIQNYRTPKNLQLLMANIAADVLVPDLLRARRGQQLFAVFGEPDVEVRSVGAEEFEVEVRGMDVYDPATGEVLLGSIREQTRRCMANLKDRLEGAGSSLENVVWANWSLQDPADFDEFNDEWNRWFPNDPPLGQCTLMPPLQRRAGFGISLGVIATV